MSTEGQAQDQESVERPVAPVYVQATKIPMQIVKMALAHAADVTETRGSSSTVVHKPGWAIWIRWSPETKSPVFSFLKQKGP